MIQIKRSELKQLAKSNLGSDSLESQNKVLVMISTALSARISYTVVGNEKIIDYQRQIDLHDRLITLNHSSPLEHCALCVTTEEYNENFKGKEKGWFRNFKGFKSYRQILEE